MKTTKSSTFKKLRQVFTQWQTEPTNFEKAKNLPFDLPPIHIDKRDKHLLTTKGSQMVELSSSSCLVLSKTGAGPHESHHQSIGT